MQVWGYELVNHIGVGSSVVCSTIIGNARASMRGIDNKSTTLFLFFAEPQSCLSMNGIMDKQRYAVYELSFLY